MPDLPVLWVETPHINCILFLNGALIGETADSPSCSICREGTVCLCLFPIASSQQFAALPYACSLHMRNGMPSHGLPEGAQLIFTAQGNLRLTISPHIYAPPQPEMPYGIGQVRFPMGMSRCWLHCSMKMAPSCVWNRPRVRGIFWPCCPCPH